MDPSPSYVVDKKKNIRVLLVTKFDNKRFKCHRRPRIDADKTRAEPYVCEDYEMLAKSTEESLSIIAVRLHYCDDKRPSPGFEVRVDGEDSWIRNASKLEAIYPQKVMQRIPANVYKGETFDLSQCIQDQPIVFSELIQ